uniref:Uncharacterized protein n=1 Tax=Amphimedon queenslandica TaxID=400682 RepID=A0A1X7UGZ1_AMPQE
MLKSVDCKFPDIQSISTFVIEDSIFRDNWDGLLILRDEYLPGTLSNHFIIIMKSCSISNNIKSTGLYIDTKFLSPVQIKITDTKLIGNQANVILNSNAISLSNVIVANTHSTGLLLRISLVTIENKLTFKNNTGVVGGGLSINDLSKLVLTSSANLEFIGNHASYKGGGIYVKESGSNIILEASNIPLTLINNSAAFGNDIYGYTDRGSNHFNLTNPNISSTGQALRFYVLLFGYDYFGSLIATDGILEIYDGLTVDNIYARPKPDSICSLVEYKPNHAPSHVKHTIVFATNTSSLIHWDYIVNECPIGFSTKSSQGRFICACSQSVSRENVTCNITTLTITHNGLLWIGMYNTSTSFNATANNIDACIINEDCLLYCFPNPVTFKLNDTDTQCVDNRGHRMCGSCTEGYSLLMGSNKCGQCHDNYMMITWIALFAVMGVLLVVLLIALNLSVSVGTLNGLLFYANIVKRYGKISRLMGSHAVPVLSTLFLLSYTKLVGTIVIVLHKRDVTLHCTNESVRSVSLWYEDPNVEYAKGKHAGLFGFALLVSVFFVIPYTLFLLLSPFYEKYLSNYTLLNKFWSHFKPIIDAYSGPMKDEYRFWPGLLLVARIPLSRTKCYDALIKKLFKKQDEDDDPLLDVTETHKTVDQQRREIVPSSTDYVRRESVVDLF